MHVEPRGTEADNSSQVYVSVYARCIMAVRNLSMFLRLAM